MPESSTESEQAQEALPEKTLPLETLVSMGGSKKRKRNELKTDDTEELHPDHNIPHNEVHTPIPRSKRFQKGKNNKRQHIGNKQFNQSQSNKVFPQNSNFHDYLEQSNQSNNWHPQSGGNNRNNKSNSKQRRREWFKKRLQKQQAKTLHSGSNQTQKDTFTPFDYSSVNFQQFRGNAGTANKKQNIKTHFKAKVSYYFTYISILVVHFFCSRIKIRSLTEIQILD